MIFISIISSFLNFIIMNIPSNISLNDIFDMNFICTYSGHSKIQLIYKNIYHNNTIINSGKTSTSSAD